MVERNISVKEIEEALDNIYESKVSKKDSTRVNRYGTTNKGRSIRLTQYRNNSDFIITVAEV